MYSELIRSGIAKNIKWSFDYILTFRLIDLHCLILKHVHPKKTLIKMQILFSWLKKRKSRFGTDPKSERNKYFKIYSLMNFMSLFLVYHRTPISFLGWKSDLVAGKGRCNFRLLDVNTNSKSNRYSMVKNSGCFLSNYISLKWLVYTIHCTAPSGYDYIH